MRALKAAFASVRLTCAVPLTGANHDTNWSRRNRAARLLARLLRGRGVGEGQGTASAPAMPVDPDGVRSVRGEPRKQDGRAAHDLARTREAAVRWSVVPARRRKGLG